MIVRALSIAGAALLTACASAPPSPYHIMPSALAPIAPSQNRAKAFSRVFCGTLQHFADPGGQSWGDCGRYLDGVDPPEPQSREFSSPTRILFVGGLGDDCLKDVRAFSKSIAHLQSQHRVEVEVYHAVPFASSADNGRAIARFIDQAWTGDPARRRFVLIGYSKGAVDLTDALDSMDAPATKVAAFVTIAGPVSGTSEPAAFRALLDPARPWFDRQCGANLADGLNSLRPDIRLRFPKHSTPVVPTYSVVGVSSSAETSQALQSSWKRISLYAAEQDGVLAAWQGVPSGAIFLGMARADHWAIALPFEESAFKGSAMNHNRFPRDALFEALVRFVSVDVAKGEKATAPPKS